MNSELLKFWYKITNNKSKYLEVKHAKREQKKRATLNPEVLKTLKDYQNQI